MLVARVIGRIDVLDRPRPHAMKLNDRFALDPYKVLHAPLPVAIGSRRHRLGSFGVDFPAHANIEGSSNYRNALGFRVSMRRDAVAIWNLDSKDKRAFLAGITL